MAAASASVTVNMPESMERGAKAASRRSVPSAIGRWTEGVSCTHLRLHECRFDITTAIKGGDDVLYVPQYHAGSHRRWAGPVGRRWREGDAEPLRRYRGCSAAHPAG